MFIYMQCRVDKIHYGLSFPLHFKIKAHGGIRKLQEDFH